MNCILSVKMLPLFFLLLPCIFAARWTEFPSLSTTQSNLHSLSPSLLVPFLQASNLSVIWFHPENVSAGDKLSYFLLRQSFLAPAADRLQVPFAEYPISKSDAVVKTLGVNESEIDTIHVYSNLRRVIYYGLRMPDALVSFVRKLQCPKFTIIEGKSDKKLFDLVDKVRVLAFLKPGSQFARSYANASLAFGPRIKFFVILDAVVARRFSLTQGNVQVHRPGEKSFVELVAPISAAEIIAFVREEAGKSFFQTHRLNVENIHSFWRESFDEPKFVLLTTSNQIPHSAHFHKLIRRSIKNETRCQIFVIDVDQFPGMAEYWSKNFGVDLFLGPVFGFVNLHNETALWLPQQLLNFTEGQKSQQQNKNVISDFVNSILNGSKTFNAKSKTDFNKKMDGKNFPKEFQNEVFFDDEDFVDVKKLLPEKNLEKNLQKNSNAEKVFQQTEKSEEKEESKLPVEVFPAKKREEENFAEQKKIEPYFILEDETVHYDNPAEKFGLTSFGSHSPLSSPFPAAHTKRRSEL